MPWHTAARHAPHTEAMRSFNEALRYFGAINAAIIPTPQRYIGVRVYVFLGYTFRDVCAHEDDATVTCGGMRGYICVAYEHFSSSALWMMEDY